MTDRSTATDLGETWFVNGEPVFLLFYHSSYQPQFFPAQEDDEMARSREYVAVSEEWVSNEAIDQLGLSVRGKRDGRVHLEPTTTWVSSFVRRFG